MNKKKRCLVWVMVAALLFGTISPMAEAQAKVIKTNAWTHISPAEQQMNTIAYDAETDTIHFPNVDEGFSARMINQEFDFATRNYVVEFDANIVGGELVIAPAYEDATHFAGLGLDFGGKILDGIVYDGTMIDDFSYATGYQDTYVQAPSLSTTGSIRIAFLNGAGGGLGGGHALVYQKAVGATAYAHVGTYSFENNIVNTEAPNRLLIQMRLGLGSISNIKVTALEGLWQHISSAEQAANLAAYDEVMDVMSFGGDSAWNARMIKTDMNLSGKKNWVVEFDTNLAGGELVVSPNYEDASHFAGLGIDFGGNLIESVICNDTLVDDFGYLSGYANYERPIVGTAADWITGTLRIVFLQGPNGSLAGGTANVYHKAVGTDNFVKKGTYTFGTNIADTDAPNYLYIQLRLGSGNISNIKVSELKQEWNYVDNPTTASAHVVYDGGNGVMTFPVITGDILGRMYQTEWDLTGKDWAVEFDANGLVGELLVSPVYEDAAHFAGVGLDFGSQILDGVVANGGFVDTFHFDHVSNPGVWGEVSDPYTVAAGLSGTARTKIEFRNGAGGTLAGGTAIVYQKAIGAEEYTELGKYTFGDNVVDTKLPNRLYIQNWLGGNNGTVSNIQITELEPYSSVEGDTNSDNKLNACDLVHLKRMIACGYQGNNQCDLEENGVLDATDLVRSRFLLVGMISGSAAPVAIQNGGYALPANGYGLHLYKTEQGYSTAVLNDAGSIVMQQIAPVTIQVKKADNTTEVLNGYYNALTAQGNTVTATAMIASVAGSKFYVTDQYAVSDDKSGFIMDRDIKVLACGAGDEGFNSFVKFKEQDAKTSESYEYFIPAQIIKDASKLSAVALCSDMSASHVWIRESQMGLPMVMTRNTSSGNTFAISRITSESYSGIPETDASWVVNKNIQYASLGISNTNGYMSMDLCYPGIEGDKNYQSGDTVLYRSHPIQSDVEHTYRVALEAGNYTDYNDAMVATYQHAFEKMPVPEVETDLAAVYDETVDFLDEYTKNYSQSSTSESPYAMGMPRELGLNGQVDLTDTNYDMGFTGQQTSVGAHLIRNGYLIGSQEQLDKGRAVIDFWMRSFTSDGMPIISYNTQTGRWATSGDICHLRHMTDGMEGILDAYKYEQDAAKKATWLEKCVDFAEWLVSVQNTEDGSYGLAYSHKTGQVASGYEGKNNTACAVRYLVRMYQQMSNASYLEAARKAAQYVYDNEYVAGQYYGGAFDAGALVDREGAIFALYAFNSMYEATNDSKWLKAAEHAAVQAASFVYTFDFNVWGGNQYNIYRDCVGTSGLSIISTEGCNVDTFAAYAYYDFFRLYQWTGNKFYYDFARLLQNNTRQFVCVDGSLPYGVDGLVCEAQNISRYYYAASVDVYLPWCSVAMINPIASMEKTFGAGVAKVELAKKAIQ